MAFCPRCGQPYAEPLDFCLYCEYDLRRAPRSETASEKASPATALAPPTPDRKVVIRNLLVIVLVVVIALFTLVEVVGRLSH